MRNAQAVCGDGENRFSRGSSTVKVVPRSGRLSTLMRAAVDAHDIAGHGKPEAGPFYMARPSGIRAIEALEDVRQRFGRDAATRVAHRELSTAVMLAQG